MNRTTISIALIGCLSAATLPATAQSVSPLSDEVEELIFSVDADARIREDNTIIVSGADQVCLLLTIGVGLFVINADDPRQLGFDPTKARVPTVEIPEGVDPCIWAALVDLADETDIGVIVSFEHVVDGAPRLPGLPAFIRGELDVELLGLSEGARPQVIAPRYASLQALVTDARIQANRRFRGPIAAARADAAERQRDAIAEMLDGLRTLGR